MSNNLCKKVVISFAQIQEKLTHLKTNLLEKEAYEEIEELITVSSIANQIEETVINQFIIHNAEGAPHSSLNAIESTRRSQREL